jgi:hypothetical protein
MLLLEMEHLCFEEWFIRLFRQNLLPPRYFSVEDLRVEYLVLCWKEEDLWKKWEASSRAVCNCFSYPKVLSATCPVHAGEIFENIKE